MLAESFKKHNLLNKNDLRIKNSIIHYKYSMFIFIPFHRETTKYKPVEILSQPHIGHLTTH